ncbi:MAG: DinB family protein [Rhodothermales bacterium]|nr:DinB family protein [Rhodothermales bacterium]
MLQHKISLVAILSILAVPSAEAQSESGSADPIIVSVQDGNDYIRDMFTKAANQMLEKDYSFKPTPEVRSFGQLLAHVASTNYFFCSTASGEQPPMSNVEEEVTTRKDIQDILSDSFDYCDAAYVTAVEKGDARVEFNGKDRSPMAVLNFRNYHALLHYGNVITYMRLRGKVPPSSQAAQSNQGPD